jgi:uncharacterized damage-inducible protein DinB
MSTSTATPAAISAIDVLRIQLQANQGILRRNTEGITHDESLRQPGCGGNCLNWLLGHLAWSNEQSLSALGQPPVLGDKALQRYHRGSSELHDPAEALPMEQLLGALNESYARIDAALATLTPEAMEAPAPFSPRKKADETVGSLLALISFHQAYHTGQTGIVRRLLGKEGAIK